MQPKRLEYLACAPPQLPEAGVAQEVDQEGSAFRAAEPVYRHAGLLEPRLQPRQVPLVTRLQVGPDRLQFPFHGSARLDGQCPSRVLDQHPAHRLVTDSSLAQHWDEATEEVGVSQPPVMP